MARLNLTTKTKNETIVLDYLEKNASDVLCEKINSGEKTMTQCWAYIYGQAKKKAVKGCACIDDATVFGWAVHFFEEDEIKGEDCASSPATEEKAEQKIETPAKPTKTTKTKSNTPDVLDQLSFFG